MAVRGPYRWAKSIGRLAGRFLMKVYNAEAIQALGAHQTAMQSNGTTKTAMAIQTHLEQHPEFVAMALDAKNAFNSVDREIMLELTVMLCPFTFQYLYRMYGEQALLRVVQAEKEEDKFIRSAQGAQQGDPLGMLLFCCAMTTVLKSGLDYMEHLKRQWKEDHKGQPDENDCDDWILVAFADDIFICAPPGIAAKMYMRLNYLVQEELKMEFHHGKLKVIQATSDPKTRLRSRDAIRQAFRQGAQDHGCTSLRIYF